ncbi:MAG: hypothetical protein FJ145_10350 [Deltaproteobacteria bacterium]|nr:hypothetical protein [Deltaproteobacteria bacterium]
MKYKRYLGLVLVAMLPLAGCATTYIKPSTVHNPAPAERLSAFGSFELQRVALSDSYSDHEANLKAAAKIQEYFDTDITPIVAGWNRKAPQSPSVRTIVIEPRIEHIKFIGGAARFWAGPLAGSSAVLMKIKYTDKASGKLIAEPEFLQRAASWSGAVTVGGQDNAMLSRIVTLVADYTKRNYDAAVGGPSGAPQELVNATR